MKLSSHLKISRHGIYYFRFIVPKILRPLYGGKTEIKYSLKTRDPVTARREAYILSAETAHIFYKAKQTMTRHDPKAFDPKDSSTWPSAKDANNKYELTSLPDGGFSVKTDPNDPNDHLNAMAMLKMIIGSNVHSRPQSAPVVSSPVKHAIKLSEGIKLFLEERASNKGIVESTKKGEARKLEHFLAWTNDPHDPPLNLITSDTIQAYLNYLRNVGNKLHDGAELTKTTVNTYRAFLNILFVFLRTGNHFPKDLPVPTVGTVIFSKGERKKTQAAESWQAFNPLELSLIFKPEHIKNIKQPHEFWLPFLGLYTGARIDELCQIFPYDIRQTNEGLWFLHIHKNDGNTVKNENSIRRVPIHPDLISLGLIEYIEDVKAIAPSGRLFPYLNYCKKNGYASVPSKAFARYLDRKEINITSSKKVFHSFRSTLVQLLEDNHVHAKHIQSLIGHAEAGALPVHYGKKVELKQLKNWVVIEIDFPFIVQNMQQLKYNRGDFTNAIIKELENQKRLIKVENARAERAARAGAKEKLTKELNA